MQRIDTRDFASPAHVARALPSARKRIMPSTRLQRASPRRSLFLGLLLALPLTACSRSAMTDLNIRRNPAPQQRYEVTLEIQDAPGPFESIEGFMQYDVNDRSCIPKAPVSGVTVHLTEDIPTEFVRVSDNFYRATVYTDLLLDDDYFGLGPCRWEFMAVRGELKVERSYQTTFVPTLGRNEIRSQQHTPMYFPRESYTTETTGFPVFGIGPEMLKPEHLPAKFTIIMTGRKVTP